MNKIENIVKNILENQKQKPMIYTLNKNNSIADAFWITKEQQEELQNLIKE
jgi:hypothetical protein